MKTREFSRSARLASLIVACITLTLDSYIVLIALPTITRELHITIAEASWLLLVGILLRHGSQLSFGRLGDILGRKKMLILGLFAFCAGSLFCGLAPGYYWLLAGRCVQGLAAGMVEGNFSALATLTYPDEERGRALGIVSASITAAAILGLLAGGFICTSSNFRLVFFVSVPFGLAGLIACYLTVPESRGARGESMDVPGALILMIMLVPLGLVLSHERAFEIRSAAGITMIAVAAVATLAFAFHESRARNPVLDRRLLRIPTFTLSNLAYLAYVTGFVAFYYATPFFLEYSLCKSAEEAGLLPVIAIIIAAVILVPSGIASDRRGSTPLEATGMTLLAVALGVLAFTTSTLSLVPIVLSMVILGLGDGLFYSPNYSAVMGSAPKSSLGAAGGVYATMETIGSFLGISLADDIMGSWAASRGAARVGKAALSNPAFLAAIRNVFFMGFILMVAGLALPRRDRVRRERLRPGLERVRPLPPSRQGHTPHAAFLTSCPTGSLNATKWV